MILLAHMLFGAAIGAIFADNPILAVILALLGHYFLDSIPHIEYLKDVGSSIAKLKHSSLGDASKVALDFGLGILAIFLASNNNSIIYLCAFVALIPDGITVIDVLRPTKIFAPHQKFHEAIQYFTRQKKISVFWKITTQATVIIASLALLIVF